jgi:hypothetical protein
MQKIYDLARFLKKGRTEQLVKRAESYGAPEIAEMTNSAKKKKEEEERLKRERESSAKKKKVYDPNFSDINSALVGLSSMMKKKK